ncbi:MAG: hypothetical protein IH958_04315 [Chloroflexi bacterium]|nr:hypothetical protein [Chloroflexota bacterium]
MGRLTLALPIVLTALAILAACGDSDGSPSLAPLPSNGLLPNTDAPATVVGVPAGSAKLVGMARAELAGRLDVDFQEILLTSVEPRDWPDACLGAAGEDEVCAQVITPGFEVVLWFGNDTYVYHTAEGAPVRLARQITRPDRRY